MKSRNPTHDIKELLKISHNWEDLVVGDSITLLASAYGEADEFFTPGQLYEIVALVTVADAPNENAVAVACNLNYNPNDE
jgi:hypothetical protein